MARGIHFVGVPGPTVRTVKETVGSRFVRSTKDSPADLYLPEEHLAFEIGIFAPQDLSPGPVSSNELPGRFCHIFLQ